MAYWWCEECEYFLGEDADDEHWCSEGYEDECEEPEDKIAENIFVLVAIDRTKKCGGM